MCLCTVHFELLKMVQLVCMTVATVSKSWNSGNLETLQWVCRRTRLTQMVSDLGYLDLGFFSLVLAQKQYGFSRNHAWSFDVTSLPVLLSCDARSHLAIPGLGC